MTRLLLLVALLTVATAACGSDARPRANDAGASPDTTSLPDSGEATHDPTGVSPQPLPSRAAVVATASPTGTSGNTIPLELRLSAACATPGSVMTAEVITIPDTVIALTAAYSDNNFTPDIEHVPRESNTTGEHTWTWTLRPDTPLGPAEVTAVAGSEAGGARAKAPFDVAAAC